MSIVGPRPLLVKYLPYYTQEERKRHSVRPGLTGWAQVNGRNALSWEEKFQYDIEYTKKIKLFFDIKILFLTVYKVFKRENIQFSGKQAGITLIQQRQAQQSQQDENKN